MLNETKSDTIRNQGIREQCNGEHITELVNKEDQNEC